MKTTRKLSLAITTLLILTLAAATHAPAQYFPPTPAPPPTPVAMNINHGETCTNQQQVTLDTNIQWQPGYTGTYKYKTAESPPNLLNLPWQPMYGPSVSYTLSSPYGQKVVYMEILTPAGQVFAINDSISYQQSCVPTSPSFRDLRIYILKAAPERYRFDVRYDFYVPRIANENLYQIEFKVIPEGAAATAASLAPATVLNYAAGQPIQVIQGIEYRFFTGTLTVNVPAQGDLPQYERLRFNIAVKGGPSVAPRSPTIPGALARPAFASKGILLARESYSYTYQRSECTGPGGTTGVNWPLSSQMRAQKGWVIGQSSMTLNRASGSATAVGQELKFDSNTAPLVGVGAGERGVRWVALPNASNMLCLL